MGGVIGLIAIVLAVFLTGMAIMRLEIRLDDLDERLRALAREVFKNEED